MNNELICSKEIKDWLHINGKDDIIKEISENNGQYNSKTSILVRMKGLEPPRR